MAPRAIAAQPHPSMIYRFLPASLLAFALAAPALAAPRIDPVPGGIAEVIVAPAGEARPKVLFGDRPTLVLATPRGWRALVGIPLDTSAGEQRVQVIHADGSETFAPFPVAAKTYPEQRLSVKDSNMVEPDAATLARIEAEQAIQDEVKSRWRELPDADPELLAPASGRLSSRFGLHRVINGQPRAPHRGLDLAVPTGTPVRAPSFGTVSYVGDFFFNGRTVFVDHGQGLISMVCHLDRVDVAPGQTVRPGQPLGASGASGRATGPHVHWSVFLNGTAVDPELFLPPPPKP
jgi:murein DD-endopeptidase MepM/ murein hydrolase activator NlpD